MKLSSYLTLATLALIAAVSCQKEELVDPAKQNPVVVGDNLVFSVNSSASSETKASYIGDMDLTSEDGKTINVSMSMMDFIESLPDQMSQTKGAMVDGGNFTNYVTQIGVYGYLEKTTDAYMGASPFTVDGAVKLTQNGTHSGSNTYPTHWVTPVDYKWPKINLDFWAWAPKDVIDAAASRTTGAGVRISSLAITDSSTEQKINFTYNLGDGTDATAMPDIMFANKLGANKDNVSAGGEGCVPLDFKHALSAVRFVIKSTKGAKVNEIKLVDVVKTGDCQFVSSTTAPFTWTNNTVSQTNKATYGHNFNASIAANTPSDFYTTEPTANFMMIPQTLGTQQISLSISTDPNSAPYIYTGIIPADVIEEWEPGKTYVYTINIDENVNVNITDKIESGVKKNVKMTNTGSVKVYLRAAITANWVDANGKIINAIWTPANGTWTAKKPDGTAATFKYFTPGGTLDSSDPGTGWRLGSDGYYYYINQVPPGADPVGTLFKTYTPGTCPNTSIAGQNAHLEMNIIVQAIQANMLIQTDGTTLKTGDSAYGWKTNLLTTNVDVKATN